MDNYYKKLKENFPTFNVSLRLDPRQEKSLESLLATAHGSLSTISKEVEKLNLDATLSQEFKQGKLTESKAAQQQAIAKEYQSIQNRFVDAQQSLSNATHKPPKSTEEAILQHMQQQEIRSNLEKMPMAERTDILLRTCKGGHGDILWAVENQTIGNLIPGDIMGRAAEEYARKVAPEQCEALEMAAADLDGALAIKNLTDVELGRMSI
jgi:hypothetical protein